MVGPLLALASAVVYGAVDFAGGVLARRMHFTLVALVGQAGALVVAAAASAAYPAPDIRTTDLLWGALSGLGSAATMLFIYRGVSRGAVSVVVPLSAVTGVALSVACGVLLLGDRPGPAVWIGIVLVVPALWLVSGGSVRNLSPAVLDGLVASCGVAVQYLALAQAGEGSGLWSVTTGRAVAVAVLAVTVLRVRPERPRPSDHARAGFVGSGAAIGLILYLLATREQLLTVAVVLASLYPALPVILGITLLHESVSRRQVLGLLGAGVAVVLLSL